MIGTRGRAVGWSDWWTRHPGVVDSALALVVLAVSLQPLVRPLDCDCAPAPPWSYALVVALCVPLAGRRRWPFGVAMATGLLTAGYGISDLPDPVLPFAGLVAVYSVAAHAGRRLAIAAAGVAATAIAVALVLDWPAADLEDVAVLYLTFTTAWLLGDATRSRRERAADLQERAEHLERTRAVEADRAVIEERTRIAREMHDVLAHSVSMMVVQAEAGPVVIERDPARAVAAFDAISATGKQTLTELRRLLGVLREDEVGPLAPQPGVAEIADLVDGARRAGLEVELHTGGVPEALPPGIALSAYRIVQEALTNVAKHAGPARATVTVEHRDGAVRVEVADDGPGSSRSHPGRGLIGMQERAASLGGEVTAGPGPRGGWVVCATLPLSTVPPR